MTRSSGYVFPSLPPALPPEDFLPPPPQPAARRASAAATSARTPNGLINLDLPVTSELLPLNCHGRAQTRSSARGSVDSYRRLSRLAVSTVRSQSVVWINPVTIHGRALRRPRERSPHGLSAAPPSRRLLQPDSATP